MPLKRITWIEQKYNGRRGRAGSDSREETEGLQNYTAKIRRAEDDSYDKLDLFAPIPPTLKPCGFYEDTLTESVWLPYRNDENDVMLKPAIIMTKPGMPKNKPFEIIDFWNSEHNVKGTFPSQELNTLMSVKSVQMLQHMADVEPAKIDKALEEAFIKHLSIPKPEMIIAKRWIEGTFFYDVFDAFPIESILGVSESGKSRLCLLNLALAYHAEGLIDPSEAGIFRSKEEDRVTLIVDEAEYLNHPTLFATLRILLNASYSKNSGYVTRYDESPDGKRIKHRFDLYSPVCISGIAGLEGVTLSRAFRIVMRRTDKDFPKAYVSDYQALRDMLYAIRIRHCFEIHNLYKQTDISHIVSARFEELFKPLFCMTKFFGTKEEWDVLAEWCKDYQTNFRTEALNVATEEMILLSLSKVVSLEPEPNQPDWYQLKALTDMVNSLYNTKLSSKTVSSVLYRLGLTKRKKVHGLTLIFASKELLESSASCIGLDVSSQNIATNATISTNSTDSTDPDWIKSAERKEDF